MVLRIFDPQLAHSVKETFGFRNVRSTAALAAPWFVGAALGLDVLSTFYAGDEPLLVARLTVTPGGGLHGLQMHELAAQDPGPRPAPRGRPRRPRAPAAPRHPVRARPTRPT